MLEVLHGLADKYSHIRYQILVSPVVPALTSTCSTLLRVPEQPNTNTPDFVDDSSALVSHRDDRTRPRKQGKGHPKCEHYGKLSHKIDKCYALHECEHCGKPGHKIDRCYALHGRPPRSAATVQTNLSPPSSTGDPPFVSPDTPAMFNKFLKWHKDQESSSSTASITHTGTSFVGLTRSSSLGPWVFDSGAADHITGNKSLFSSLSSPNHLPSVTLADGSRVLSHGVGTVKIFPSLTIDNVLYVPRSPFNLLSISGLTRSLDCVVSFTHNSVYLQDRSSKQVIGTGCESHSLYYLRPSTQVGAVMESPSLLHAQLGHPSLAKLQQLVPALSKLSHLVCESCQLGKYSRTSFPRSVTNDVSSPFALVHSDIWGPNSVKSTLGFQYFVTFIDDYSRCTWLFLMKHRSELFHIFQSFFNEIKTQFGVSIRVLRSDNGREYLSHSFKQFMASHGILHQTSCAYTPQQNGVAERKNRHLIETTRTLLIHGAVLEHFWGDVILTACYLINRMPSSVLKNNIPHSILFPHDSLHPLPLRVFGSTCFVHNFSPGLDKLSPRSHKCVFLGFTRSQKGYKCFSPFLNRYFVSADVTFDEFSLYFKSQTSPLTPSSPDNSFTTFNVPFVCDPLTVSSSPSVPAPQSASPPPLQVYSRRNRSQLPPCDSTQVPTALSPPL